MKTISILTPTRYKRRDPLRAVCAMIKHMIFPEKEFTVGWLIASVDEQVRDIVREFNDVLKGVVNQVNFLQCEAGSKVGRIRNKLMDHSQSDYIVWMDDDDYYAPEYISQCLGQLHDLKKPLAGVVCPIIHDYVLGKYFQFTPQDKKLAVNCALCCSRQYAQTHRYDETVNNLEEQSFTNGFTEEIAEMSPRCMILSSHLDNTFSKRKLILMSMMPGFNAQYRIDRVEDIEFSHLRVKENVAYAALQIALSPYGKAHVPIEAGPKSKFDVVWVCGMSVPWTPYSEDLGGSEQAIKYLSAEFVRRYNLRVAVYTTLVDEKPVFADGINYYNWYDLPVCDSFDTVILWRETGLLQASISNIKANRMALDLHDCADGLANRLANHYNKFLRINSIVCKSKYHKQQIGPLGPHPVVSIIPNGVRIDELTRNDWAAKYRHPYRFCYTSCYSRGLEYILVAVWPLIVARQPTAELHLYYGMDLLDEQTRTKLTLLIARSRNVCDHGRQPFDIVAQERYRSTFQLYLSQSPAEIDCLAVKEAVVCGCIPILSNFGVFQERFGVNIDIARTEPQQVANAILVLAADAKFKKEFVAKIQREALVEGQMRAEWQRTAREWFGGILNPNKTQEELNKVEASLKLRDPPASS